MFSWKYNTCICRKLIRFNRILSSWWRWDKRIFKRISRCIFIPTSAKNREGIINLFEEIAKKHTVSSNITIKEEEGDEPPVEENKGGLKIENGGKDKKLKKKGFC